MATVGDAIRILRIVVGLDPDDECADANENGSTDVGDAIKVLRCVVGLDAWPIGECGGGPIEGDYQFVTKWGSEGSGDGQFDELLAVALDADGNVYAADRKNNRIQKFTSDGTFITKWGSEGSDDGRFNMPHGVAVDTDGNVYVADTYNHRIQKFRPVAP